MEQWTDEPLRIAGIELQSRLLVGTGKYASLEQTEEALKLSGTQMVTVAIRRLDAGATEERCLMDVVRAGGYHVLPNTAGCFDAESAVRTARLARDLLETDLIKLEVLGDPRTLLPDPVGTLAATEQLVGEGFKVMVYTSDDPRLAVHLADLGAASVMPAGSPIGSGRGVLNPTNVQLIMELVDVPVIVDAGVGTASDVAVAMELGAAGVLLNTGIAGARDPLLMARAMRAGCEAGRQAYLAGRIERRLYANASSPEEGLIEEAGPGAANSAGGDKGKDPVGVS
ncbi:MAG TPA: thiazole synthase [Planctomycetes bacterium]|nr:thiazole synthase [Planctomycetota bacterium]HIK60403.1 thiazole synthase [Planctomycetota bacterium]